MNNNLYRGAGLPAAELGAGQGELIFSGLDNMRQRAGTASVRQIANTATSRDPDSSSQPAIVEQDVPGAKATLAYVALVPSSTPRTIPDWRNGDAVKACAAPDQKCKPANQDVFRGRPTRGAFSRYMTRDLAEFSKRVKNVAYPAALFVLIGFKATAYAAEPAANFPSRPIRIVVPSTPGGQPDIVARQIVPRLVESMGQQVIVDNRPGAGTMIGTRIVATSNPDGYSLLSASAAHTIIPVIRAHPGFDTVRDFDGVSMTANAAYFLVVSPSLGVNSMQEFIAFAKTRVGQINYASAGVGTATHFGAEMFKVRAGINALHVPHKGVSEALIETMSGRIHFFMAPFGASVGLIRDGRLRALAVTTSSRVRTNPELPTIAESGLPNFRYESWAAMYAPAKTPRVIIDKLNREIAMALRNVEVEKRLQAVGIEPVVSSPKDLDRFVMDQIKEAKDLARQVGIKPE